MQAPKRFLFIKQNRSKKDSKVIKNNCKNLKYPLKLK